MMRFGMLNARCVCRSPEGSEGGEGGGGGTPTQPQASTEPQAPAEPEANPKPGSREPAQEPAPEAPKLTPEQEATFKGLTKELDAFRKSGLTAERRKKLEDVGITPDEIAEAMDDWIDRVQQAKTTEAEERGRQPLTRAEYEQEQREREQRAAQDARRSAIASESAQIDAALSDIPESLRPQYRKLMLAEVSEMTGSDAMGVIPATAQQIEAAKNAALKFRPVAPSREQELAPTREQVEAASSGPVGGPGGPRQTASETEQISPEILNDPEKRQARLRELLDESAARREGAVPTG